MNHFVIPVKFSGQRLLLDGSGVLVWPQYDLLIFSDLHLEKGSFLSQFANPLPRFDSTETLKRMQLMMTRYNCSHVICLGDSLHDGNALSRMQNSDLAQLNQLIQSVEKWTWILGNHDPEIPESILGQRAAHLQFANILLVHEPESLDTFANVDAQIIGHFHPKSTYKLANRKVSGKSFVCDDDILFMPAFGKYTGGLDIKDKAFLPIFTRKNAYVYLTYHQKIYLTSIA
jgi:DNA ligase-associated metallophosphoesterase